MENTKFRSHQCTFKRNENPNFENLEQICCILSPIHDFYVTSLDPIPHPLPVPSWNLEQLEKKHSNKKKVWLSNLVQFRLHGRLQGGMPCNCTAIAGWGECAIAACKAKLRLGLGVENQGRQHPLPISHFLCQVGRK